MSVSESEDKQTEENQKISEKLADQLGVDAEVAGVLIDEGFARWYKSSFWYARLI
jgi:N utilization substance protein A